MIENQWLTPSDKDTHVSKKLVCSSVHQTLPVLQRSVPFFSSYKCHLRSKWFTWVRDACSSKLVNFDEKLILDIFCESVLQALEKGSRKYFKWIFFVKSHDEPSKKAAFGKMNGQQDGEAKKNQALDILKNSGRVSVAVSLQTGIITQTIILPFSKTNDLNEAQNLSG